MSDSNKYRITVGFDGSDGARRAIEWAVGEAQCRGAQLRLIQAWTPGEFGFDQDLAAVATKHLEEEAAVIHDSHPDIEVSFAAVQGHAGRVLIEAGRDADMLVVGTRGRGGFTGLLLGSVGQQVTTHPGAPTVVVVR